MKPTQEKNDKKALYIDLSLGTPTDKEKHFAPYKAIFESQGYKPDNIFARYSQNTLRTIGGQAMSQLGIVIFNDRNDQHHETRSIRKILLKRIPSLPYLVIGHSSIEGSHDIHVESKKPFTEEEIKKHIQAALQKFGHTESSHKDMARQMGTKKALVIVNPRSIYHTELKDGLSKAGFNSANVTLLHLNASSIIASAVAAVNEAIDTHKPDVLLLHGQLEVLKAVHRAHPKLPIMALMHDTINTAPYDTAKRKGTVGGTLVMDNSCAARLASALPALTLASEQARPDKNFRQ